MAWIAVVTNAGRALLDSYAAGGHTLNLTGATVGSGVVADANLRIQTEITDEKDTASIISAKEIDDGVKYKIQVGPASDSVGAYTAHQIGIWANLDDGADTLLMLAQDAADGMAVPLASVSPAFAFAIFIAMTVDNTEELTVEIDETAYVTIGTLQEAVEDIKATPFVVSIPTGQWSGSGSDYYITINATNVTPDSILIPNYDSQSESRLKGPVWCVPGDGSFTIHTTKVPSNTVEILIQFFGVKGEAQYQVLADVYSKSQTYSKTETDSKIAQSTANMARSVSKSSIAVGTSCTITFPPDNRCSAIISVVSLNSGKYATYIYEGYGPSSARQAVTPLTPGNTYYTVAINDDQSVTINPTAQITSPYWVGVLMVLGNPPTIT